MLIPFFWVRIDTNLFLVMVTGVTFAFIAFYVYEKKEEDIDGIFIKTRSFSSDLIKKFLSSKKSD